MVIVALTVNILKVTIVHFNCMVCRLLKPLQKKKKNSAVIESVLEIIIRFKPQCDKSLV